MNEIQTGSANQPQAPKLISTIDEKGHGRWYAGALPQTGSDRPVIVFVPGLGDFATSFWGGNHSTGVNDLYKLALADGFRTAFVSFMADGEKPFSMWQNGKLLAAQLQEICRYYQADSVYIAAHSKGGVDAQTAAVYYGAAPRIKKLITLSSPHWGSQLADLAYSSFGWELAERLGQHSEGCFCMTTAYMQAYRKAADVNPLNTVPIETFAGNGDGAPLTEIWAAARFMAFYGENDGVVTVKSAQNPRGHHRATLPFNHIQMMTGKTIWPYIKAEVLGAKQTAGVALAKASAPFGLIYRGGRLDMGVADAFPVDSSVTSMEISIAVYEQSDELTQNGIQVFAPSGVSYKNFETMNGPFGAKLLRLLVDAPQAGSWHIITSGGKGAYLAQIRMNGTFAAAPEGSSDNIFKQKTSTVMRVLKTYADRYETESEQKFSQLPFGQFLRLGNGVYTLESVVKGALDDGSLFERDIVRPVITGGLTAIKELQQLQK